jgi:hypothetical protein
MKKTTSNAPASPDFPPDDTVDLSKLCISLQGNMNPAAVPVIKESLLIDKRIGELATIHPLTYYFGTACNLIGVLLESEISGVNESGDLLIVKKGLSNSNGEKLVYDKTIKKLFITNGSCFDSDVICIVGDVIEERFNGR